MTISLGLLALMAVLLDAGEVIELLLNADPTWLLFALAITVLQVLLSAWRWRFTAGRLGLTLPFPAAVREYYLATFINQVLPGGVLGDAA
ncbi:MAG: lysylphosphatidylglycerol synthase domain-containing protein, partial [Aquisalimonadaceae bacterium]